LPTTPFTLAEWKRARVNIDYHVEFDGSYSTALVLGRLARRAGTTQRAVLEQLIQDADRVVTQAMSDDEFDHYFALQCNNE